MNGQLNNTNQLPQPQQQLPLQLPQPPQSQQSQSPQQPTTGAFSNLSGGDIMNFIGGSLINSFIETTLQQNPNLFNQHAVTINTAYDTPATQEEIERAIKNVAEWVKMFNGYIGVAVEGPSRQAALVIRDSLFKIGNSLAEGGVKMVVSAASAVPGLGAILQLLKLSNDITGIATNSVTAVENFIGAITAAAKLTTNNINNMAKQQMGGMNNYKTRSTTVEKQTTDSINEFLGIKEYTINNKTRRKRLYNKTKRNKIYKLKPKSKRIK